MCGIVGYVGPRPALDVVVGGCAVWSTAGTTRPASPSSATEVLQVAKKAGRIENLDKELATRTITGTTGMGHTRWATHGAPNDRNAHPHTGCQRPHRRRPQRHHRELRRTARRARARRRRVRQRDRHRDRCATSSPPTSPRTAARSADAVRAVCRRLQGAFTLVLLDAEQPGRRRGRPPQLAARPRRRRRRDVPRQRRRRVHRVHPRRRRARSEPGRRDHAATATRSPTSTARRPRARRSTSTGTSPPPRRAATTTSCSRRSPSSRPRSATPCSGTWSTARSCWTSSGWTRRSCATSTRCSSSPAAPRTTRG